MTSLFTKLILLLLFKHYDLKQRSSNYYFSFEFLDLTQCLLLTHWWLQLCVILSSTSKWRFIICEQNWSNLTHCYHLVLIFLWLYMAFQWLGFHVAKVYWIPSAQFISSTTRFTRYTSYPGQKLKIYFWIFPLLVISSFSSRSRKGIN